MHQVSMKKTTESTGRKQKLSILYYGIKIQPVGLINVVKKYFKAYQKKYENEWKEISTIIDNRNFSQREHITLAHSKVASRTKWNYYSTLINERPNNIIPEHINAANPNLQVTLGVSSIIWTPTLILLPVDYIDSDDLYKDDENEVNEFNMNEPLYHITIACTGFTKAVKSNEILAKVIKENKKEKFWNRCNKEDMKDKEILDLFDLYKNEDDLEEEEKEEKVDNTTSSTKDLLKKLKVIRLIKRKGWSQLQIEPIKLRGYFTSFFY